MKFYSVRELMDRTHCCLCGVDIAMRRTKEEYVFHFVDNHGLDRANSIRFKGGSWKQSLAHGTFVEVVQKQRVLR